MCDGYTVEDHIVAGVVVGHILIFFVHYTVVFVVVQNYIFVVVARLF